MAKPIRYVEKPNGKLRICLDPRNLNNAIKRERYQLPTAESIMGRMKKAKYFSKLDASTAYWQMKLDKESSKLLAFLTPKGRYKFNVFAYGIHSASEIFQAEAAEIINGIEGVDNNQDDIIIRGTISEEHNERLHETLERSRKSGRKLNLSKCNFAASEITFSGHTLSAKGIQPDPLKTRAILDMPIPSARVELQRFLGMINYLGKFIPNLSQITSPLCELLRKEVIYKIDIPQIGNKEA